MSLYVFLIMFSVCVTLVGAVLVLVLQNVEQNHDEEIAMHEHLVEQFEQMQGEHNESNHEKSVFKKRSRAKI
jgi:hypothetical protein